MAFFDDFTAALKQKWLQYFQANQAWMTLQMEVDSVKTPDGGRRPPSYLILGILNALEPKLAQLMWPFSKLNPDADAIIEVLELNFDPDIAMGNKPTGKVAPVAATVPIGAAPVAVPAPAIATEPEFEDESDEGFGLGGAAAVGAAAVGGAVLGGVAMAAFAGEEEEEIGIEDADAFDDIAIAGFDEEESEEETDEESIADLGDMALAGFGLEEESEESEEESADDLGGLGLDAWGEETSEDSTEESIGDFSEMSFEGFGEESEESKESEEEDAFGDMTFEDLGDTDLNLEDSDEWK